MAKPLLHTSLAASGSVDTHLARGVSNPAPRMTAELGARLDGCTSKETWWTEISCWHWPTFVSLTRQCFRLALLVREVPRDSRLTCIRLDTMGTCQQPILCLHMSYKTGNREPGQRRHAAVRNAYFWSQSLFGSRLSVSSSTWRFCKFGGRIPPVIARLRARPVITHLRVRREIWPVDLV